MENTMSVLAKTDSEVSSQTQSSPSRSPSRGRPVYYVQSPSRDSSNDGEKTTNSFNSSPVLSPMGSPPHSHSNSSLGPHSRESSSTRFSGSRKHNSSGGSNRKGSSWKPWKDQFDAIEEEGLLDDDANSRGLSRRSYFMAFIVGFLVLFSLFSLILWGASQPQRPTITMKIKKFYQSRKSQRSVMVTMKGSNIPLYGGGASLGSINGGPIQPVPLTLNFMVRSRAYVLGKLVKPKFYKRIQCSVVMDSKKMNSALTLKNKCTYQ
ncbi:uncharacterized protein LOC133778842 isoform X2 [Humulus lupulus]|uniref:uncharacterized protein LOC133778842 isoform X2 n=1 Tax=Humulus lupulus TaxID=3486 RepID=UPI002B409CBB|nr:uncharacterized protein LOC133778842 isoform X2 [Humulus lupulus]